MKITIPIRTLSDVVSRARSVSPTGLKETSLKNLLIRMNAGTLSASSSDGEAMEITVTAAVENYEGPSISFGVNSVNLDNAIGVFPRDAVVELSCDGSRLQIKSGRMKNTLPVVDPEFFSFVDVDYGTRVEISPAMFREALLDVESCAARPGKESIGGSAFESVRIFGSGETITFDATDGRRAARRTVSVPNRQFDFNAVIPVGSASRIPQLLADASGAEFLVSKNRIALAIVLDVQMSVFFSSLMVAEPDKYPNLSAFAPDGNVFKAVLRVEKDSLLDDLVRPANNISEKAGGRGALFTLSPAGEFATSINVAEVGSCEAFVPVEILTAPAEEIVFGCRPAYLSAAVRRCHSESVVISIKGEKDPIYVQPDAQKDQWFVILPVYVSHAG